MWSREGKEKVSSGQAGARRQVGARLGGLQRALLAGGESFPEEVFTGGFAISLGKR